MHNESSWLLIKEEAKAGPIEQRHPLSGSITVNCKVQFSIIVMPMIINASIIRALQKQKKKAKREVLFRFTQKIH